MENHY